ncbi:MAG TPA: hypothetical protein VG605_05395 [Puia sp.]|nr:hypothetical protein [Puia sp.]
MLEELQQANKSIKQLYNTARELEVRVKAFEDKQIDIPPPDLEPLNVLIRQLPATLQKEMLSGEKLRYDRQGHYKLFIRWFFGTVIAVFLIGATYVSVRVYIDRAYPFKWQSTAMGVATKADSVPVNVPPPASKHKKSKSFR